jgi:hypothetical protein
MLLNNLLAERSMFDEHQPHQATSQAFPGSASLEAAAIAMASRSVA